MKTNLILIVLTILVPPLILSSYYAPQEQEHIVIGWNDLGMHCSNKDFDSIVILPPYNNFRAQVIRVGNQDQDPEIITSGITMTYEIPGNTYSVGKTNFWNFEDQLFGVELDDNVGLTGVGLDGSMNSTSDHFGVDGVPITPFTDADTLNEDPYQLALLKVYDVDNVMLASTQSVMPVSNEIGCVSSGCHGSQWDILDEHSDDMGFDPTDLPNLCANCHADVALGMPGIEGVESLSYVMHEKHKDKTNDCYKCHPGENTQCFRGVMHDQGMVCADCHGDMEEVSESIAEGRQPWLDEPSCGTTACHGSNYAEEPGKLYKDSKGHGGLYCSACHGSTHAILPSTEPRDNVQNIALQGYAGTLGSCITCHGVVPDGPGPHGISAPGPSNDASLSDLTVDGTTIDGFSPSTLTYTYEVPAGTLEIPEVDATPNHPNATMTITNAVQIPGTTEVFVLAEDSVSNLTYTVDFVYGSSQTLLIDEHFETGLPEDYFTGKLILESGVWYGKNVKNQESGYEGESVKLRKEVTSYIRTPKLTSAGTLSFYYKGDEDESGYLKIQKKVAGEKWITIDKLTYNDNEWSHYEGDIDDPTANLFVRIWKSKKAKGSLIIDEFTLSSYALPATSPNDASADEQMDQLFKSEDNRHSSPFHIYAHSGSVFVQIDSEEPIGGSIEVFDLSGTRHHFSKLNKAGTTTIQNSFKNGIYIIRLTLNGKTYAEKVFLN